MAGPAPEPSPKAKPSVFGTPDQDEMIARLDSVDDDDLASGFFSATAGDAEDAAVRMFDLGIRTLGEESAPTAATPFAGGAAVSAASTSGRPSMPEATETAASTSTSTSTASAPVDFTNPALREAFILGGPDALPTS